MSTLAPMYTVGHPVIRKVLKIRIWGVPGLLGQYVATVAAHQPGELPKSSSSNPSERRDAQQCNESSILPFKVGDAREGAEAAAQERQTHPRLVGVHRAARPRRGGHPRDAQEARLGGTHASSHHRWVSDCQAVEKRTRLAILLLLYSWFRVWRRHTSAVQQQLACSFFHCLVTVPTKGSNESCLGSVHPIFCQFDDIGCTESKRGPWWVSCSRTRTLKPMQWFWTCDKKICGGKKSADRPRVFQLWYSRFRLMWQCFLWQNVFCDSFCQP